MRTKSRPPLGRADYTIEDRGYRTRCWIRVGHLNNMGYGKVVIAGVTMYAHRAMYEQELGPIPDGLTLDHLCRVPACLRPTHLEPVSHGENIRRGKSAKLTRTQVDEIRVAPASISTRELAKNYPVCESQVSRIRRGLKWRD